MPDHPVAKQVSNATYQVFADTRTGSAVAVAGGRHLVTAAHVTPSLREVVQLFGVLPSGSSGRVLARVEAVDTEWDLAVLTVDHDDGPLCALQIGDGGYIGEDVWHCGYPHPMRVPTLRRGMVSQVLTRRGQAVFVDRSMFAVDEQLPDALLVDMPTFKGASGGPIADQEGRLLAVVSRGPHIAAFGEQRADEYFVPMGLAYCPRLVMAGVWSSLGAEVPGIWGLEDK